MHTMADRVLLFGGTFDPVHNAHLVISRAAAEQLGVQQIWLVPSAAPPHKESAAASVAHRLAMLELAIERDELFGICDVELTRGGQSYTIDTVTELQERFGKAELFWLIGADMLAYLPKWYQAERLVKVARFVTAARPPVANLEPVFADLAEHFDADVMTQLRADVVEAPLINLSSTDIRERVATGEPIADVVPPAVADYIVANGLYR